MVRHAPGSPKIVGPPLTHTPAFLPPWACTWGHRGKVSAAKGAPQVVCVLPGSKGPAGGLRGLGGWGTGVGEGPPGERAGGWPPALGSAFSQRGGLRGAGGPPRGHRRFWALEALDSECLCWQGGDVNVSLCGGVCVCDGGVCVCEGVSVCDGCLCVWWGLSVMECLCVCGVCVCDGMYVCVWWDVCVCKGV